IGARLRGNAKLQAFDRQRLAGSFSRYRALEQEKKELVRDTILHRWLTRQQERLLVGTGSRLNSAGADLRRRLTMRGERAMRLRQVIAIGQSYLAPGESPGAAHPPGESPGAAHPPGESPGAKYNT